MKLSGNALDVLPSAIAARLLGLEVEIVTTSAALTLIDGDATITGARACFEHLVSKDGSGVVAGNVLEAAFDQCLAALSATNFARKQTMLQSLLAMGVRSSGFQQRARDAARDAGLRTAQESLESLIGERAFLGGDSPSAADAAAAGALYPVFMSLYDDADRAQNPATTAWMLRCFEAVPFAASVTVAFVLPVQSRIGGQIDVRPEPALAAAKADAAMEKNKGHKKVVSQRQAEKAAKKAAPAAAAAAAPASKAPGASAPAAGEEPAVKSDVAVVARAARTAHDALATAVGVADSEEAEEAAMGALAERLGALGISAPVVRHEAVFTVAEQGEHVKALGLPGLLTKNLFVKAKKAREPGDSRFWLVICRDDRKVDLKALSKTMKYKGGVRLGDEATLKKTLGVVRGAVSLFAVANDPSHQVHVAVDKALVDADFVNFHPLSNRATATIAGADICRFLDASGHHYEVLDLDAL